MQVYLDGSLRYVSRSTGKKNCLIIVKHYSIKILRFNPIALQKAKTLFNFGLSECKRLNENVIQADSHKENFDNNLSHFF